MVVVRNVTIALADDLARWARIEAARRDVSVSRFIHDLIDKERRLQSRYGTAMRDYFARSARPLSGGAPYPAREDLYERPGLR